MFKAIKWIIRLIVLVLIVFGAGYLYFNYIDKGISLTETQEETIETLGRPEQFAITYLPQGEGEEARLVRQESWFYPSKSKSFSFLNGELINAEDLKIGAGDNYGSTVLKSEDFDFYTTLEDIEKQVGKVNLAAVEAPVFFEGEVETYVSKEAVFIFEDGFLSYMETLD